MAIGKKKRMEAVVIGFDEVKDSLGDIANTVMYCREGNCSSIIQMANPVQQWCADVDQYYAFMDVLNNIIQIIAARSGEIKEKWLAFFGEIRYYC